jgi:serine/threonine protein kinase
MDLMEYLSKGVSSTVYLMNNTGKHVKKIYKDAFSKDDELEAIKAIPPPVAPPGVTPAPWLQVVSTPDDDIAILSPYGQLLEAKTCTQVVLEDYVNAIKHIHTCGYAHNDLRLPNLLVCEGRGLVIDFGFACTFGSTPKGGTGRATARLELDPKAGATKAGDLADFVEAIARLFSKEHILCKSSALEAARAAAGNQSYDDVLSHLKNFI